MPGIWDWVCTTRMDARGGLAASYQTVFFSNIACEEKSVPSKPFQALLRIKIGYKCDFIFLGRIDCIAPGAVFQIFP